MDANSIGSKSLSVNKLPAKTPPNSIGAGNLMEEQQTATPKLPTKHLPTLERIAVDEALAECGGNRVQTAKLLGVHPRTLQRMMARHRTAICHDSQNTN